MGIPRDGRGRWGVAGQGTVRDDASPEDGRGMGTCRVGGLWPEMERLLAQPASGFCWLGQLGVRMLHWVLYTCGEVPGRCLLDTSKKLSSISV